jgi:hypothetical protein
LVAAIYLFSFMLPRASARCLQRSKDAIEKYHPMQAVRAFTAAAATRGAAMPAPWGLPGVPLRPGVRVLYVRFASSDVRDALFCVAMHAPHYISERYVLADLPDGAARTSPGSKILGSIHSRDRMGFKDTQELLVVRSVAGCDPTAAEERDLVEWPKRLTLQEVMVQNKIAPNKDGEVFVLAGPARIGDRAFYLFVLLILPFTNS